MSFLLQPCFNLTYTGARHALFICIYTTLDNRCLSAWLIFYNCAKCESMVQANVALTTSVVESQKNNTISRKAVRGSYSFLNLHE